MPSKTKASRGRTTKARIPAVVPKVVYGTFFIGVIPACVATACQSGSATSSSGQYGVAAVAYQCYDGDPNCYGVAAVAYQCFDANDPNCPRGVADATFGDAPDGDSDARDGDAKADG